MTKSLLYQLTILVTYCSAILQIENEFDTYNEECPRVRRPWNALSQKDKAQYREAMLQIRKNSKGQIEDDDLITVASVHQNFFGEVAHYDSAYLFWHGYLLWEMESRIRNLGGEYAYVQCNIYTQMKQISIIDKCAFVFRCFGMPYWDFSNESKRPKGEMPFIFGQGLGGDGDASNGYTVNGFSWDVPTSDYWVPEHCFAEGDEYPFCSLKRSASTGAQFLSAEATGYGIIHNPDFSDFSHWYSDTFNIPHNLLTNVNELLEPVITSYDPIWYLFHSMVSYHQAIWTDCQNYDEIEPTDLDKHPEAYSPFCDGGPVFACGGIPGVNGMSLDSPMAFGGYLPEKEWAFIKNHDLTVRKSYHLSRWNVIYDLKDDTFFAESGLKEFCDGKLNDHWFMNAEEAVDIDADTQSDKEKEKEDKVMNGSSNNMFDVTKYTTYDQMMMILFGMIFVGCLVAATKRCRDNKKESEFVLWNGGDDFNYGSV